MPGLFGNYRIKEELSLNKNILSLLSHGEEWFDGKALFNQYGFHGVVDFQSRLKNSYFSLDEKSIIVYGDVYSYKGKKMKNNIPKNLLLLYEKDKFNFLRFLNGSFAVSIFDDDKLFIITDKIGSKNVFYTHEFNKLLYSSEIKVIRINKAIRPNLNEDAISEFFTFSYVLGNKTLFEDIMLVPPATILSFKENQIKFVKYHKFSFKKKNQEKFNINNLIRHFVSIMERSVKLRMENHEKFGIFLSGGLDSRLLTGFAKRIADKAGKELISFTFGTKNGIQEKIAKRVSKKLKIKNEFFEIDPNVISKYAEEIVYKGDGHLRIRDAHFISFLREIRPKVDVILVGLFCSELFGETLPKSILNIRSKKELINILYLYKNNIQISRHLPNLFLNNFAINSMNKILESMSQIVKNVKAEHYFDIYHNWEINQTARKYIIPLSNYMNWYVETKLPFLDDDVITFAHHLPIELRIKKRFIHLALKYIFPSLANIPWEKSGLPSQIDGLLLSIFQQKKIIVEKIKRKIERNSQSKIMFRNLDYRSYDYYLRTGSKNFIIDKLIRKIDNEIWDSQYIRKIIEDHLNLKKNNELIICDILQIELLNKLISKTD